ncbi:MAG: FtsW/RodA/SpoVE family cell cycle protein [Bacilli bacterium]|nr:FtsW/RodA/SpoVE family cell cycle protein [Bacilli bacterium]
MKKALRYMDKPLLIISIILFSIGLVMVFSASNVTAYMSHAVSPYNYFLKQALFLITGTILCSIMICFSTKTYGRFSRLLLIIFTCLLLFVLVSTEAVNEANSWIDFGFFSLQPSEFIKVITIVWLSYYYDKKAMERSKNKTKKKEEPDIIKSLIPYVICIVPAALIFLQPDLGTTIIFILIVILIFTASPIDKEVKKKI